MEHRILQLGYDNFVPVNKVIAILKPGNASVKTLISNAGRTNTLINVKHGRKTRSVLLTSDEYVILSNISPSKIAEKASLINKEDFLSIGEENFVPKSDINALVQIESDSKPIERLMKKALADEKVFKSGGGKKSRSLLVTENGYIFYSKFTTKTLAKRFQSCSTEGEDTDA